MSQRSEQELIRFEKLRELREKAYPYPNDVEITAYSNDLLDLPVEEPSVARRNTIAGRIVQRRLMGKAAFVHLLDSRGKIQIYVRKDDVGEESFEAFKHFDIGDIVETSGYIFETKTGEKTLYSESIRLLSKCLIPLPEKWHGLTDVEARYRHRYVDLIANPEVREVFKTRARIIQEIRHFLDQRDYIEVETPVLSHIAGGATARPFKSYYNALSMDVNLRIALELPLKKLIVGGLDRVYEIGRNFRNEGLSKKHNPEFTMLEFYQAYADYEKLMDLTEEMIGGLVERVTGVTQLVYGEHTIDFSRPWKRISMVDSIYEIGGVSKAINIETLDGALQAARDNKIELENTQDWGKVVEALWDELVEHKLINPTFITRHPFSISPLARQNLADPKVVDRFELIVAGMELANAFSELNDPIDQRERFEEQARRKAAGALDEPDIDEDYLRALEYGMPPTGGEGIGIDRLVMLLTNSATIRDVLLFPQLKPEKASDEGELTQENQEQAVG